MDPKKALYSVELSQLFPGDKRTSSFVNSLANKPVTKNGKVIGKIVDIKPIDGTDDYMVLMRVKEEG